MTVTMQRKGARRMNIYAAPADTPAEPFLQAVRRRPTDDGGHSIGVVGKVILVDLGEIDVGNFPLTNIDGARQAAGSQRAQNVAVPSGGAPNTTLA